MTPPDPQPAGAISDEQLAELLHIILSGEELDGGDRVRARKVIEAEQQRRAALVTPQPDVEALALLREAAEIMEIVYAGNFPAGIESFLVRAHRLALAHVSPAPAER